MKLFLAILCAVSPALLHAQADEGLLQRLFRLIHRDGKYEGRLSDIVRDATQKSGTADTLSRVLLVNRSNGETVEWKRGRGAVEPVVCPDGRTVFVRRASRVERAEFGVADENILMPGDGKPLPNIAVRQIFGCTAMIGGDAGIAQLWVETTKGAFTTVRLVNGVSTVAAFPEAFRSDSPLDTGLALRILQGVRADGVSAMVRDGKLVVERREAGGPGGAVLPVLMPVTGDPAWLGDSDWIVVTGLQD